MVDASTKNSVLIEMDVDVNEMNNLSNEEYLVLQAKNALKYDSYEAKSWMLTAQTLFPHNFGVQFEAYHIEKSARNIKEAAKCFASLFTTFPEEEELWIEIKAMTSALSLPVEENEVIGSSHMSESEFLKQLFNQVPKNIQHSLLLTCAEKTPDNMEHCTLMLLLFKKFPMTIAKFGPRLMENLITAEKHSLLQNNPVNSYRKLLVCDLLPLLGSDQLELQPKNLHRLLNKAIEFYLCYLFNHKKKEDLDYLKIEEPWVKLWEIMLNIGSKLAWDLSITFAGYWNKDNYWTALLNSYQSRPLANDEGNQKQIVYCGTLIFVRCLHEYLSAVEPNSERAYVLIEAFCSPYSPNESLPKRSRHEEDINQPALTAASPLPSGVLHSFATAVRCWDLLHVNEIIEREFSKLMTHLRLEMWLKNFQLDLTLFKGNYEQLRSLLMSSNEVDTPLNSLAKDLLLLSSYYFTQNHSPIIDIISKVASSLPESNSGSNNDSTSNSLYVATRQPRHLHFLPLTRKSILHYCVKVLLAALKAKKNDLTLGHILVLMQLDNPVDEELLSEITSSIQHRGGFSYPIFTSYIVNVDVLEQFAYLSSDQGSKIPLDILPPGQQLHNQRRMSTRGVDKGVKEDIKMAIRRQVSRSNEPIDNLIIKFLTRERELIYHSLVDS